MVSDTALRDDPALVARARQLLERVPDPEIPVLSIRELGILRDVRALADGGVEVWITPTYSGCPATEQIAGDIVDVLRASGIRATVRTRLAPAWTTDWIDAAAREKLRAFGIAPPRPVYASEPVPVRLYGAMRKPDEACDMTEQAVCCPRCGSSQTQQLSRFASTACKALYRCLDCKEPFDYFKPH